MLDGGVEGGGCGGSDITTGIITVRVHGEGGGGRSCGITGVRGKDRRGKPIYSG